MPIQSDNIQFRASQVMDDVPEGGGRATAVVIRDGASNEIFPDISEADRAGGRVRMRKVFLSVDTPDRDILLGANVVVARPPADPNVSVSLFSTGDYFDRRSDARNRLEAYLFAGPEWGGYLLENHISGQGVIQIFQRVGTPLPPIGRTLVLVLNEGAANEQRQYVRVIRVTVEERTFSTTVGGQLIDYPAWVVACELSDVLRYDFAGSPPHRLFTREAGKTRIRDTTVADAARYYGATVLTQPAGIGDMSARVQSIFTRLVPSAQTEIPLIDRTLTSMQTPMIAAAHAALTYSAPGAAFAPGGRFVLRSPGYPGSISVAIGGVTITDDGLGAARSGGTTVGTWNYATGELTLGTNAPSASGTASVNYLPAAPAAQQSHTVSRAVTAETRSLNWVIPLSPIPAPGAVELAYMSQGNWYVLRDDGTGTLRGTDPGHGTGTQSFVTGTLSATLGALPDAGTRIIVTFASPAHYAVRAGASSDAGSDIGMTLQLPHAPVKPGTLSLTWYVAGQARTASDSLTAITGTGLTGTIDYQSGIVRLRFAALPDRSTGVQVAWEQLDDTPGEPALIAQTRQATSPTTIDLGTAVTPGSLRLNGVPFRRASYTVPVFWLRQTGPGQTEIGGPVYEHVPAYDYVRDLVDGADGMLYFQYGDRRGTTPRGSIDYATGACTITPGDDRPAYYDGAGGWSNLDVPVTLRTGVDFGSQILVTTGGSTARSQHYDSTAAPITIDLTSTVADTLVPGSVLFRLGGLVYAERDGTLYVNIDPQTGAGLPAGSLDYTTGLAALTYWPDGAALDFAVLACLTRYGQWSATTVTFRTASAPLRPQAFAVSAVTTDGEPISATTDANGIISGTWISGALNYEAGVGVIDFGRLEPDPDNPSGPQIWAPRPVDPSTIRYNAVAYSYLPLDADLLGIDPVRLPSDGRVPMFRSGDFAVFGRDVPLAPQTVTHGQVIDLGAERLSRVRIVGADGLGIGTGWSVDLDAGLVTIDDTTGWAQPVTISGRIEDMVRLSDAQITGDIAFTRPLSHAYPAGSIVSSALMLGDQRARVSHFWDQQSWNGTWSDTIVGNGATASYDDALYPPEVTNEGAITERWVIRWQNTTTIEVIGEHVGIIYVGPPTEDVAPGNPAAGGAPYFRLRAPGFGIGWSAGNIIRLNTVGAQPPIWAVLTVQQAATTVMDDAWELLARGDVDRP